MPTPLRRRLRLARRGLGYSLATALVLVALVVAVASRLLPLAERHPAWVAEWLGERSGRPVAFDAVRTEWTRRGPLLRLDGLRIGAPGEAVEIGDAEMLVSLYAGLLPGTPFSELRLRGLDLTLERAPDGRWGVRGLPGQRQRGGDPLDVLEGLGELQVIDGRLTVSAPALGIRAAVPRVDLRIRVDEGHVHAGLRAWPGPGDAPLDAALVFDRAGGDGRLWAGAERVDLGGWSDLLRVAGVSVAAGTGRAEAWVALRGNRVVTVDLDADLDGVRLAGAPLVPATSSAAPGAPGAAPMLGFSRIDARARWQTGSAGWRIDAPRLRFVDDGGEHALDGLLLAGGTRVVVAADELQAGPLLAVAALSDRLQPSLRRWLLEARPDMRATSVVLAGPRAGPLQVRADVASAGFAPAGRAPGVQGLSGRLVGDDDGLVFTPDADARVRLAWPGEFERPHDLRLDGTLVGWRGAGTDGGWRVGTPGLALDAGALRLALRGGLRFEGDGTRPRIDLAADVEMDDLAAARAFWLRGRMPRQAVEWLDGATLAGRIEDGRALVVGDLDDWPFRQAPDGTARGLFRADARLADASLRFHPDWPRAEALDARARFVADGFDVEGEGTLAGIDIPAFSAGIARFGLEPLRVEADGAGDAARLLDLLRASPLRRTHGEILANLEARGPARVGFGLQLPLGAPGHGDRLAGHVALDGVQLRERRWDLAFDQVHGRADYAAGGFAAEGLRVRHDGQPARLSLRAGDAFVADAAHAFEAGLVANIAAERLLERVPALDWLRPHLSGRSDWRASVALPRGRPGAGPGTLRLDSDLAGTALALPAPLEKAADATMPARVEVGLPLEGGEVVVRLGDRFGVRARTSGSRTGIHVGLGDAPLSPPPADGLVVEGRVARLDALGWVGLLAGRTDGGPGAGTSPGKAPGLRRVDVTAERLALLGGTFADTRLRLAPAPGNALAVRTDGKALQGALLVPASGDEPVSGRFERLHWNAPVATGTPSTADPGATPARSAGSDADPAAVPRIAIDIADLRVRDLRLGQARLRTRPVATGLRIEEFSARTPAQQVSVTGDWLGRGAGARSSLALAIDSRDFGSLLDGLGVGGRLEGGEGRASLEARWPGSLADFQLARLEGELRLDARDGRLVDVEPGAGRVLGLLSIAELPRRLTLDFRDFFARGFAFNTVQGGIRFAGGQARSDGLVIDGPAAEIRIRGSADLRAQTYDQTIEVKPRPGGLLTVVGAIAGGPVGAAIGAAANAMLQEPLGEAAERVYRVTGPWKSPQVDVVAPARAPAQSRREPDPAGGGPAGARPTVGGGPRRASSASRAG